MNYYITQTFHIHSIRINAIANSSVFQIGSAGVIKPVTKVQNTGNFTEPAPEIEKKVIVPFKIR